MNRITAHLLFCFVMLGFSTHTPVAGQDPDNNQDGMRLRVGTFDSRLVATAYVRSEAFRDRLAKMHADLKDAKESGDSERVKELESEGPALQDLIHKQGFSTWPVHDILRTIKDRLPDIAKQAEVDLIVSKWDVVFQRDDGKVIDITDLMVAPFNPDEETRKVLNSLKSKAPVPLDQFKKHR